MSKHADIYGIMALNLPKPAYLTIGLHSLILNKARRISSRYIRLHIQAKLLSDFQGQTPDAKVMLG